MVDNGTITKTLNCGESYTIVGGKHSGSGKITANSLASQTDGDAVAGDIIVNKKVWVKGVQITGSMANQGAKTSSLNCGSSYTIPAGYHNGSGKVTANSLSSQTAGNLVAAAIRSGYYGYSNGSKVTGNIASLAGGTYTPSSSSQTISCSGKYMTSNIVISAIPSSYVSLSSGATVFNSGSFLSGYGWGPRLTHYSGNTSYSTTTYTSGAGTYANWQSSRLNLITPTFNFTSVNKITVTWTCTSAYWETETSSGSTLTHGMQIFFILPTNKGNVATYIVCSKSISGKVGAGTTVTYTADVSSISGHYWMAIKNTGNGSMDDHPEISGTIQKIVFSS